MTTSVQDAQAAVAAAGKAVDEAEEGLAAGTRAVSAAALHKLRDGWRHAELSAKSARRQADESRQKARLDGLAAVGAEVDKLAEPERTQQLADAVRAIADACSRFRALAEAHDADAADLVAAAADLDAEPAAPEGPRGTSAYVAVKGTTVIHKRTVVSPLGSRVEAAIGHAVSGDTGRALAEVKAAVAAVPEAKRPDYLLRNVRSGMIAPIYGELNDGMRAQLKSVNPLSGDLVELSGYDVDRWMAGELA